MATHTIEPLAPEAPLSFIEVLGRMSPEERLAAYRSGAFTRGECVLWTARYPEEVPPLKGEFEWITLSLADLDRGLLQAERLDFGFGKASGVRVDSAHPTALSTV